MENTLDFITEIDMSREIIAVYSENARKITSTLCGKGRNF